MLDFEKFRNTVCFKEIIEKSPIGVVISSENGDIFFANETFCHFLGYSLSEIRKKSLKEISQNGCYKHLGNSSQNTLNDSKVITFENKYISKKNKSVWSLVKMSQVTDPKGSVLYNVSQVIDIEDKKKKELAILELSEERKKFTKKLISVQESERKKIAREIHDEMGQLLTALKISIAKISDVNEQEALLKPIAQVKDILDASIDSAKSLATRLHPAMLDHLGLLDALKYHFKEFQKIFGFKASFSCPDQLPPLSEATAISLFRVFQEALNNVLKHAKASTVKASLEISEQKIILSIEDNGIGFKPNKLSPFSLGVISMRERIESHEGSFSLNAQQAGSILKAILPLQPSGTSG